MNPGPSLPPHVVQAIRAGLKGQTVVCRQELHAMAALIREDARLKYTLMASRAPERVEK